MRIPHEFQAYDSTSHAGPKPTGEKRPEEREWQIGETEKREQMPRRRARGGTNLQTLPRFPSDRAITYDEPARTQRIPRA